MKVIKNIKKKTKQSSEGNLEYKAREKTFKESEEKYKILIETSGEGMLSTNRLGIITYVNPTLEKMFKINASESLGTHFTKYLTKTSVLKSIKLFFELLKGKSFKLLELEAVNKKKQVFPIDISASPIIKKEKIEGIVCIIRDITERKQAEEALRESEVKYKALFVNAAEGILVADLQTKQFCYANPAVCRMFGYTEEEFFRIGVADIHPKESLGHVLAEFGAQVRGEKTLAPDLPCLRKDGNLFYANVSAVATVFGGRKCNVGFFTDITERKRAEEKIKLFSDAVNSAFDYFFLTDIRGNITYANESAVRAYGYTIEELLKLNIDKLDADPEAGKKLLQKMMAKGKWSGEVMNIRKNKEKFPSALSAFIIKDEKGNPKGTMGILRDITERKRAEEELKKSETRWLSLTENTNDVIMTVDSEGTIQFINKTLPPYTIEETIGKSVYEYVPKEQHDTMRNSLINVFRTGKPEIYEVSSAIPKLGNIWFATKVVPIKIEEKIVSAILISTDITERKQAEETLKESEKRQRTILDSILTGIVIIDAETHNIVEVNPIAAKMIGAPKEKIVGSMCHKFICPAEKGKCPITDLRQNVDNSERVLLKADGKSIPILKTVTPFVLNDRKCLLESFVDITDRKRAEDKIEEQRKFLEKVLKSLTYPFYVIDVRDYTIKIANTASGFGDLSKGLTCYALTHKRDSPCTEEHICPIKEVLRTKKPAVTEHIHYDKDGNEKYFEVHGDPIFDNGGNVVQMIEYAIDITERKKTEEALQKNLALYLGLIETTDTGFVIVGQEGKVLDANPEYVRLSGYEDLRQIRGRNVVEWTADYEKEKNAEAVGKCFREGQIRNLEIDYVNTQGKITPIEINATVVKVDGVPQILTLCRDITERKKAEEKIIAERNKIKIYLDSLIDGITVTDKNANIIEVNKTYIEMLGYKSPLDIIGKPFTNFIAEKEIPRLSEKFTETIKNKEQSIKDFEVINKRKSGSEFPAMVNMRILWNEGEYAGCISVIRDITERKKAEVTLREEKNKLEKYLNVAGAIILFLSPDGKILLINKRGCEILGYEPKDILNKDWFAAFIPVKDTSKARAAFDGLIEGKADEIKYFETHVLTKNKNQMNIGWGSVVIKDGLGERQAILSIGIDITELEQAKTTISQLSEVNKLKDDFLNIATHELKTPLTTIIGLSDIMKGQNNSLNPKNQKYISIINAEGRKLNHIIKRVLTVTRFESGREIIAKDKINLKELIFSFLPSLEVVANKKDLKIAIDIKDKNINLISDKEKISEIVYNFVDNAAKHSPAGQTITISASMFSPKFAKIEVIDRGEGIPKKLQSKLFAKFSQLDSSLSRSQEGTGLGLYICKLIAEKLGGEIGIKSALGKGSSFFFTLPIENAATQKRDFDFKAV